MRYFTFDLIAAANDWVQQSSEEHRKAEALLASTVKKYQQQLELLEYRVSRDAWQFFQYGFGSKSLHDARLLSLQAGDGLSYIANGKQPFFLNHRPASVIVVFLNYEQTARYIFDLRRLNRLSCDLFVEEESHARSIGDLYIYELTAVGDELQLGFLFATGASIVAQFGKLVFRRKPIKRSYEVGQMYS